MSASCRTETQRVRLSPVTWGIAIFLATTVYASADDGDAPSTGVLFNNREDQALSYDCTRASQSLACHFVRTSIRKLATPEELANRVAKFKDGYKAGEFHFSKADCGEERDMLAFLQGTNPTPNAIVEKELTQARRADFAARARTTLAYCERPTEENAVNFMRREFDQMTRTCRIHSEYFEQVFRHGKDDLTGTPVWIAVHEYTPNGCGLVELFRFEADTSPGTKRSYRVWKYTERRVTANPNGESCRETDPTVYQFAWIDRERLMGCEYIQFE